MDELIARLETAERALSWAIATNERGHLEMARLKAKLDGIRLALSYAREMQ